MWIWTPGPAFLWQTSSSVFQGEYEPVYVIKCLTYLQIYTLSDNYRCHRGNYCAAHIKQKTSTRDNFSLSVWRYQTPLSCVWCENIQSAEGVKRFNSHLAWKIDPNPLSFLLTLVINKIPNKDKILLPSWLWSTSLKSWISLDYDLDPLKEELCLPTLGNKSLHSTNQTEVLLQ